MRGRRRVAEVGASAARRSTRVGAPRPAPGGRAGRGGWVSLGEERREGRSRRPLGGEEGLQGERRAGGGARGLGRGGRRAVRLDQRATPVGAAAGAAAAVVQAGRPAARGGDTDL